MSIKLSHDQFLERLALIRGNEFLPLEEYKGHKTPIKFLHTICSEEIVKTPRSLIVMRTGCSKCNAREIAKRNSYDHQWFLEQLKVRCGGEYLPLTNYINIKTELKMLHVICGNEFNKSPEQLLRQRKDNKIRGCSVCSVYKKRTHGEFLKQVERMYPGEFTVLSEYLNGKNNVKLKHHICGKTELVRAKHFLDKLSYCKTCTGKKKKTTDIFKQIVRNMEGEEYIVLSDYVNAKTNILLKHVLCGNEIEMTPDNFQRGKRCKYCHSCKNSKGERKIIEIFKSANIQFETEYIIPECRNINPLPFDFAVFDQNYNEVLLLIEYDGAQHSSEVEFFGGLEAFNKRKILDKIKTDYCMEYQIQLLRINYLEYINIENILNEKVIKGYHSVN